MAGLLDVFSAWFRSFGYTTRADAAIAVPSGAQHVLPLLVERDARRVAAFAWINQEAPPPSWLDHVVACVREGACDSAIALSLGPVNETQKLHAQRHGVQLWDAQRVVQELGEAVLIETCPDVWERNDPLVAPRPSRVLAQLTQQRPAPAPPTEAAHEPPFAAPAQPMLASPQQATPPQLEVPAAFGIFDQLSTTEPATPPTAPAAPVPAPPLPSRTGKPVLRSHVSRALATSLVKKKIGQVERSFLRLVPYHVFDFEAHLLVDGSLDAEVRKGRMAVEAAQKRILDWTASLETGDVASEGADIDEKKVRVTESDAAAALKQELVKLVTRDVVMAEDGDEWSVVVKKKVTLGPDDVRLRPLGTFWLPVWRVSGKEGAVEIDANSGNIIFEEVLSQRTDAQLI